MRKIIVLAMCSLDGVMQGPGGPQEDPSGDFNYGGWTAPYKDELYSETVRAELQPAEYLLGRKTFEIWENYWPHHGDFWPWINKNMKYVFSHSRSTTHWENTAFIKALDDIIKLKSIAGPDLHTWGSSELVSLLLAHELVDELRLKIHPLLLGKGKRLFSDQSLATGFELISCKINTKGVIFTHYQKKGLIKKT